MPEVKSYPRWKHHPHQKSQLVHSAKEEESLGKGWHESLHEARKIKADYDKEQEAKAAKELEDAINEAKKRG